MLHPNAGTSHTVQNTVFLDGLRGLAALYVVLYHARWLMWEGFSTGFVYHPNQYSLVGKLIAYLSLAFYYGHQAVLFFFVLSGFVIHLHYAQDLKQDLSAARFDWVPFMLRRFRRLYPAFLFAVILTFLLDQVGIAQGFPIYFQRTPYPLINTDIIPDHSLDNAIRTLLFLESPAPTPSWGVNVALWSLKVEWWFYVLYPFFWLVIRRSIVVATVIQVGLFCLSYLPGPWRFPPFQSVLTWMIVWWFGVLLAEVYVGRLTIAFSRIALLGGLFVILPFLVSPVADLTIGIQDVLWGLGFTGLLAFFLALHQKGKDLPFLEGLQSLGEMSYTAYVIHLPILVLISGWLMSQTPDHSLPQHFGWVVWGTLICLAVAYLAHFLVEKPFVRRRDVLRQPGKTDSVSN